MQFGIVIAKLKCAQLVVLPRNFIIFLLYVGCEIVNWICAHAAILKAALKMCLTTKVVTISS